MKLTTLIAYLWLGVFVAIAQPPVPGSPSSSHPQPPFPPLPKSPIATFRQLLTLPPAERAAALASRPVTQRESLEARLAVYESLPPAAREERLQATDLYWHLQQLIRRAPSERNALLAAAPDSLRPVLTVRLALWDQIPASDRQVLIEHEGAIRYFAQMRSVSPPPLPPAPASVTPAPSESAPIPVSGNNSRGTASSELGPAPVVPLRIQAEWQTLANLSRSDLERIQENWRRFFEGRSPRRERALLALRPEERAAMEQVLNRFQQLTSEQRSAVVGSFARLATMSPGERSEFLRHAGRWESLPAAERQSWRQIVTKLPVFPPLPPAASTSTPPSRRPSSQDASNDPG